MKNKLFLLALFIYSIYNSQTVSDIGKIVLSVGSAENVELSLSSEERLKNKLIQIVNNSGMTSFDYSNFYITPKIAYCIYNHRTTKTNQKYPSVNL